MTMTSRTRGETHLTSLNRRAAAKVIGLYGAALVSPRLARAQEYPVKPVRLIVPYSAGGAADAIARPFAERLGRRLGQPVVIDNRPGAATNIGSNLVARSEPDGHTLLFGTSALIQNIVFGPRPNFDLFKAFTPISPVSSAPFVLAVHANSPIRSLSDFIAAGRQSRKVTIGTAQLDLFVELLKMEAKIDIVHVPYKGGAPAITDLLGSQIDSICSLAPALMPHLDGGKMRALAVGSTKRLDRLPMVPTFHELGVPHEASFRSGVLTPSETPASTVAVLSRAMDEINRSPEFSTLVRSVGSFPEWTTPQEFTERLRTELAFWEKTAKVLPHLVKTGEK